MCLKCYLISFQGASKYASSSPRDPQPSGVMVGEQVGFGSFGNLKQKTHAMRQSAPTEWRHWKRFWVTREKWEDEQKKEKTGKMENCCCFDCKEKPVWKSMNHSHQDAGARTRPDWKIVFFTHMFSCRKWTNWDWGSLFEALTEKKWITYHI